MVTDVQAEDDILSSAATPTLTSLAKKMSILFEE
jgi:hypothetical protein